MRLLLDTHCFIWMDDDFSKLSAKVQQAIINPSNTLYLSIVSIWELQIKTQLGKLEFNLPLEQKVEEQVKKNRLEILAITQAHIYGLEKLPMLHRDPFDRLLISQAITEELQLISSDSSIQQYAVSTLW
jgi:PIN domain nuclease of toxin-antitoxin system